MGKAARIEVRLTQEEKARVEGLASAAGVTVSEYVVGRLFGEAAPKPVIAKTASVAPDEVVTSGMVSSAMRRQFDSLHSRFDELVLEVRKPPLVVKVDEWGDPVPVKPVLPKVETGIPASTIEPPPPSGSTIDYSVSQDEATARKLAPLSPDGVKWINGQMKLRGITFEEGEKELREQGGS